MTSRPPRPATAGPKGEIVPIDGRLAVGPGRDEQRRVRAPQNGAPAVRFASGRVPTWQHITMPGDRGAAACGAFVQEHARGLGPASDRPLAVRVERPFPHLPRHVATGEPWPGGRPRAHRDRGAGHANPMPGMRLFHRPGASGRPIAVCSGAALQGTVSQRGERCRIHVAAAGATVFGHGARCSAVPAAVPMPPRR